MEARIDLEKYFSLNFIVFRIPLLIASAFDFLLNSHKKILDFNALKE